MINRHILLRLTVFVSLVILPPGMNLAIGQNAQDLKPRVPPSQLEEAKALHNPFAITKEFVKNGRSLYEGKAFCSACHGIDGTGRKMVREGSLKLGPSPTNFSDAAWQAARSDGELFWILKHGSHGTDMVKYLPLYLDEEEAWQIVVYIRSLGKT